MGNDVALIAHLMRRAGFGASRAELDELASKGYGAVVDDLVNPERFPELEEDVWKRYNLELSYTDSLPAHTGPLDISHGQHRATPSGEDGAALASCLLATAWYKGEHVPSIVRQIETFRQVGMTDMKTILLELAKDPAMNYWLDNCENHRGEPNENWGRELLELFSMGVGHYSEEDIKNASRAFTGWTFTQPIPLYPFGSYDAEFLYVEDDHDESEKTFLGETGNFNGEDIIDIIVRQPATAAFICRHIYNFFVADEPQVPAWELEAPRDPEAMEILISAYFENDGAIRPILETLFNSDFFKEAQFKKVKSPAELVAGAIKLVGTYKFPEPSEAIGALSAATGVMGQQLMNPPTVEGWHTGHEWIDGGTLNERINFAVNQLNDLSKPGVQDIVSRMSEQSADGKLAPDQFVNMTLELAGHVAVDDNTMEGLDALRGSRRRTQLRHRSRRQRQRNPHRQNAPAHRIHPRIPICLAKNSLPPSS